jgi:hypothetical protein
MKFQKISKCDHDLTITLKRAERDERLDLISSSDGLWLDKEETSESL